MCLPTSPPRQPTQPIQHRDPKDTCRNPADIPIWHTQYYLKGALLVTIPLKHIDYPAASSMVPRVCILMVTVSHSVGVCGWRDVGQLLHQVGLPGVILSQATYTQTYWGLLLSWVLTGPLWVCGALLPPAAPPIRIQCLSGSGPPERCYSWGGGRKNAGKGHFCPFCKIEIHAVSQWGRLQGLLWRISKLVQMLVNEWCPSWAHLALLAVGPPPPPPVDQVWVELSLCRKARSTILV